jgi:HAMP domain-containing protein
MMKNSMIRDLTQQNGIGEYHSSRLVIAGAILCALNLLVGIVLVVSRASISPYLGILFFIAPFFFSGLFAFSSWLVWLGKVKTGFHLIVGCIFLVFLFYSLTTSGYGFLLGIASFVILAILVFETVEYEPVNWIFFLAGLFGPLLYLIDHYGLIQRVAVSGLMMVVLSYLVVLLILIFCISFLRNYSSISIMAKFVIPFILLSYLFVGGIVLIANNQMNLLVQEEFLPAESIDPEGAASMLATGRNNWETNLRLLSVFSLFIATVVVSGIARFMLQPLSHLADLGRKVLVGNLNVRANIKNQDEIGVVAEAFNTLSSRLRQIIETLESRVTERTRVLSSQNEELAHKARRLQAYLDITQAVAGAKELEEFMQLTVDALATSLILNTLVSF